MSSASVPVVTGIGHWADRYDALILDKIPNESHDVPMDIVVAETAIYRGEEP